jgi:hypothetical protein
MEKNNLRKKYLNNFRQTIFLFRVFVTLSYLSVITWYKNFRNFRQTRVAILVTSFGARMTNGTGAQAGFVAFLSPVLTILNMA